MWNFFTEIMSWSEVWGILIPLTFIIFSKRKLKENDPLRYYVIVAVFINFFAIGIAKFQYRVDWLPDSNLFLYNLHSILRAIFFLWYLSNINLVLTKKLFKIVAPVYILLFLINFLFLEPLDTFSIRAHAAESITTLSFCILYFLATIQDESNTLWMYHPSFIICIAIGLFETINLLIFLFFNLYNVDDNEKKQFAITLLLIFSFSYVALCSAISWVFYKENKK